MRIACLGYGLLLLVLTDLGALARMVEGQVNSAVRYEQIWDVGGVGEVEPLLTTAVTVLPDGSMWTSTLSAPRLRRSVPTGRPTVR